jgi:hypothetical protein
METEQKTNEVIAREALQTVLQQGVDFEVTYNRTSRIRRILHLPVAKKFVIYPIHLGTLMRISSLILAIEREDEPTGGDYFEYGLQTIVKNKDAMVKIAVHAVMNSPCTSGLEKFRAWMLRRFLDRNLSARDLLQIIALVIAQMDVTDFLASIVSIRRASIVGTIKKTG